jgi:peptide/nickel transport system substrate-binding protein
MRRRGGVVATTLFLTGALLLATFAFSWAQDATFLVLTRNQPRTIDPAIGADNPTRKVHVGVYEPLIDHKLGTADVANLEGVLAKNWKVSADGLTYTFALRENVKFHDGSTLSAEDVKVSLDRMKKIGLGRSWALDPVKEVRIVNPLTVELILSRPYPPFILGLPVVYILSADAVRKNQKGDDLAQGWLGQNDAGTGPFRVREFKVGQHIIMEKFDAYWRGWPQKHLSRVMLKLVAEPATQKILMEGGQGHWADTISPGDLEAFARRPEFVVTGEPTWGIQFFWMNSKKAPLDDVRVRRAMRAAFPYEQMIRDVMRGKGTLPQGFLPPGYFMHAGGPTEKTDVALARKLLAEAGVQAGTQITIEHSFGLDFQRQAVELFAGALRPLGIDVKIQGVPFATMLQHVTDAAQRPHMFYSSADPDTADPDSFLYRTFHSKSRYWANFGFGDPKLDELLEQARYELKPERRAQLYAQVQILVDELSPAIPSFVQQTSHLLRANVKGYRFHPPYAWGAIAYYPLWIE